ncbi:APC family permease [Sphingosinicella rhizophila]|uniref:APC family permease n=1 Tax=Sphingosinicella rhizophila TaxID=3050082 RepID=A0ABU3QAA9_9SPHN|nr:APC family permease [Sphingosinicella sp. GR2756]MDT9600350.1 APC family permease [Sphingosinicella sp. GR2756]
MKPPETGAYRANLRPVQLFNLAFGVAIGVGWIMVMGIWLSAAGPLGAALAFAVAAMAMLTIGSAYASVAIEHPLPGGEFAYARRSFGMGAAFWVGWFLAFAYVVVIAFEIVSVAWLARELVPALPAAPERGFDLPGLAIGGSILLAVIAFNLRGARAAARLQDVLVLLKILLSTGLIVAGFALGDFANLQPLWGSHESGSPLRGMLVVLAMAPFFYAGFGVVAQALGDVQTPATIRALPRVMVFAILGTMLFYGLIILASAAAAPRQIILDASLPAAAAFGFAFGTGGSAEAVLILGLLGLLTILNGLYFAAVRLIQALAQNGLVPGAMGRIHASAGISVSTGIFVALSSMMLAALGKTMLAPLVNITSMAFAGVMGVVCAVLIHQRRAAGCAPVRLISPAIGGLLALLMVAVTASETFAATEAPVPPEWIVIACAVLVGLLLRSMTAKRWRGHRPNDFRSGENRSGEN